MNHLHFYYNWATSTFRYYNFESKSRIPFEGGFIKISHYNLDFIQLQESTQRHNSYMRTGVSIAHLCSRARVNPT